MIPRIVHYCWLSAEAWDTRAEQCFSTWQRHLEGFEFRLWDRSKAPRDVPFLEKMLAGGDWAYASDYLRLHALAEEGGVYLDLDVEVVRSLSPLLGERAFIGYEEDDPGRLGCHVIGAERGHPFVRACLDFYRRSWRLRWSFPPTMPRIVTGIARKRFGYGRYEPEGQILDEDVRVLPARAFSPTSYRERSIADDDRRARVAADTFAIHHWRHGWSWLDKPLRQAIPRIPWLFMGAADWRFVARGFLWPRARAWLRLIS